jgi:hypothetical protein
MKKTNPQRLKAAQYIVQKYVPKDKINWPRDIKIAFKLYDKYPDIAFWMAVKEIEFESMVGLLTKHAKKFIQEQYNAFKFKVEAPKVYEFGEKIGEDVKIQRKNLKDFIDEI